MIFTIKYLTDKNLIKKIPTSILKAEESIKTAESWLKEAHNNFEHGSFRSCIISSYLVIFHSGRAILFFDGYREKSHFAVARYLEDKYVVNEKLLENKWIDILDYYREIRHDDQYSTSFYTSDDESEKALKNAELFLKRIKKLFDYLTDKK